MEVTGKQLPLIKSVLSQIKLTSKVSRVRIEIDSTGDILKNGDMSAPTPEPHSQQTDTDSRSKPSQNTDNRDNQNDEERPTVEQRELAPEAESVEPQFDYPQSPTKDELPQVPLSLGTNQWKVAATVYRLGGWVDYPTIRSALQNTDWEMPSGSIKAALSSIYTDGIIQRKPDPDDGRKRQYAITQFGADVINAINAESTGWSIRP